MPAIAFAIPLLPDKEELDRQAVRRFAQGEDAEAYAASRRSHGITREAVWHQATPDGGTFAVVLIEANELDRAIQGLATSSDPIDVAFREALKELHGIDLAKDPVPEITLIADTTF